MADESRTGEKSRPPISSPPRWLPHCRPGLGAGLKAYQQKPASAVGSRNDSQPIRLKRFLLTNCALPVCLINFSLFADSCSQNHFIIVQQKFFGVCAQVERQCPAVARHFGTPEQQTGVGKLSAQSFALLPTCLWWQDDAVAMRLHLLLIAFLRADVPRLR